MHVIYSTYKFHFIIKIVHSRMTKQTIVSILTSLLLAILALSSCKNDPSAYEIKGKISNVVGEHFYLSYEKGDSIIVDTIPISDKGEFSVQGSIDTLTVMSFYFNDNTRSTFALVNKGWDVKIEGDVLFSDLLEIKGGDVNNDISEFKNKNKELLKSRAELLNLTEDKINNNDSVVPKDYLGNLKNLNFELSNIAEKYVQSNPDKIASVMLLSIFFKDETSVSRLDENLKLLRGKASDFQITQELKTFVNKVKPSTTGSMAPAISLEDINNKRVRILDFRGKYVLLSFASTTCKVCIEEKKNAVEVYNQLKKEKRNIEFITIVKDIEQEPISKNITDSVKWHIIPVKGGWSAQPFEDYNVHEMPYNILISPSNHILERDVNIFALPKKMEELAKTAD